MKNTVVSLDEPDNELLGRVLNIQRVLLAIVALLAIPGLLAWVLPGIHNWLPSGAVMPVSSALVSLACSASLAAGLSSPRHGSPDLQHWLAAAAICLGIAAWLASGGIASLPNLFSLIDHPAVRPGEMTIQFAGAFVLLGLLLLVLDARRGLASYLADGLTLFLGIVALFLEVRSIFAAIHLFSSTVADPTPASTFLVLLLLTVTAFLSRARYGFFDIFLGGGMGGRIVRHLTIIVIPLPFLREAARERLIRIRLVPEHGAAALLGAISSAMALTLVILITRYIRRMERSIRHLTLRDELTGLYNLRGFKLLAEQALRLAQRSNLPFSLLFVDVDDLKQINDSLGHSVGSMLLAETAELLKVSFREADVVGRVGGDEFAIAGQLSHQAILEAAERLEQQTLLTRTEARQSLPISLSIGYVTANPGTQETLEELLDKADAEMYNQKRRKKLQLC